MATYKPLAKNSNTILAIPEIMQKSTDQIPSNFVACWHLRLTTLGKRGIKSAIEAEIKAEAVAVADDIYAITEKDKSGVHHVYGAAIEGHPLGVIVRDHYSDMSDFLWVEKRHLETEDETRSLQSDTALSETETASHKVDDIDWAVVYVERGIPINEATGVTLAYIEQLLDFLLQKSSFINCVSSQSVWLKRALPESVVSKINWFELANSGWNHFSRKKSLVHYSEYGSKSILKSLSGFSILLFTLGAAGVIAIGIVIFYPPKLFDQISVRWFGDAALEPIPNQTIDSSKLAHEEVNQTPSNVAEEIEIVPVESVEVTELNPAQEQIQDHLASRIEVVYMTWNEVLEETGNLARYLSYTAVEIVQITYDTKSGLCWSGEPYATARTVATDLGHQRRIKTDPIGLDDDKSEGDGEIKGEVNDWEAEALSRHCVGDLKTLHQSIAALPTVASVEHICKTMDNRPKPYSQQSHTKLCDLRLDDLLAHLPHSEASVILAQFEISKANDRQIDYYQFRGKSWPLWSVLTELSQPYTRPLSVMVARFDVGSGVAYGVTANEAVFGFSNVPNINTKVD